ncbi:MAG: hypothetical protein HY325_07010 [Chloroflexi bacterium]|nr:hypothetical protein [Chloroflexota bacterium]
MTNLKKAQFSVKWDVRTRSPRKLWRALHDFLDDNGFEYEYKELEPRNSPIEGTAIFSDTFIGQRDRKKRAPLWFLRILIGLLLCLTIILIPLGLVLIGSSLKTVRTWVRIDVEGEAYRARGADINTSHSAEVLDVVADTRVTLRVWAGKPVKEGEDEIILTKDKMEIAKLRYEFEELNHRLDVLLPKVSLPSIEPIS